MVEQGVGQPQVAFRVFEVNGVDLVRHGGGADFAGNGFLLEETEGNVAPHVTVEIDQRRIKAHEDMEVFGHPVVRFDLNGVGVPCQSQRAHELLGQLVPVDVRVGGQVGVVVAHGTIDLAHDLYVAQLFGLACQTIGHIGEFLAHGSGGSRLPVGARQHGDVGHGLGHVRQRIHQCVHLRHQHLLPRFLHHQRVGEVVDVFAGAGEVNEFLDFVQFGMLLKV